jgi:hypothetical protein
LTAVLLCVTLCVILLSGCDVLKGLGLIPEDGPGVTPGGGLPSSDFSVQEPEAGVTTTVLTLVFAPDIAGLNAGDITVASGDPDLAGITVEAVFPTGQPGFYTLVLSGVSGPGNITVAVHKDGYAISPASQTVPVYYASGVVQVTFDSVTDNGAGSETTTQLKLDFTGNVTLEAGDITVTGGSTGAAAGTLTSEGDGTYILGLDGVTAPGTVIVGVNKNGYSFTPSSKDVSVQFFATVAAVEPPNPDIREKFGVIATGKDGVTATFTALHEFIANGGLTNNPGTINLGDWIDLDTLTVAEYNGKGKIDGATNTPINASPFEGYSGASLRLIVVGINSFYSTTDKTQHVVFQFQNVPVSRRMNENDSTNRYVEIEMREYLVPVEGRGGNFLAGLYNAGVPSEGVLWAPMRRVANGYYDEPQGTDVINDFLWLPTEWEMFGDLSYPHSSPQESSQNQARLDYYPANDDRYRIKYDDTGAAINYWEGSRNNGNAQFCLVSSSGSSYTDYGSYDRGIAPAFCVK